MDITHRSGPAQYGNNNSQVNINGSPSGLRGVISHREVVDGLVGFRQKLKGSELPFIPPQTDSPSHPRNILDDLKSKAGDKGTLLVAPAGAGKSRTCFEVGDLAVADGWDVLHVQTGEFQGTDVDIAAAIAEAGSRVLLILDYLNDYQGINLATVRHRLLVLASAQKTKVAILASARPGWLSENSGPYTHDLFDVLPLDNSREAEIRDGIIAYVAPEASRRFGASEMAEMCGTRPILALLIAQEIESQVRTRQFTGTAQLAGIRRGDLLSWLERRLGEDDLAAPKQESRLRDQPPTVELQACAAMAAVSPQAEPDVIKAAKSVLGDDEQGARSLIITLRTMGWIEDGPEGVTVVHDIVSDHLMEAVLARKSTGVVREDIADTLLRSAMHRGRSFGRMATNLSRVLWDFQQEARGSFLSEFCVRWLESNSEEVGDLLAQTENEGGYALGAILDNPAWAHVAAQRWDSVAAPWIEEYGISVSARHLYYKGLRSAAGRRVPGLVDRALEWLGTHHSIFNASFVIQVLIVHPQLTKKQLESAITHLSSWLRGHVWIETARFSIQGALFRRDLSQEQVKQIVSYALRWLGKHHNNPSAWIILHKVLSRKNISANQSRRAISHAQVWLTKNHLEPDASFVLQALLGHEELTQSQAVKDISFALKWIRKNKETSDVGFVVSRLLGRNDLSPEDASEVKKVAFGTLGGNLKASHSYFIRALLEQEGLSLEHRSAVVEKAFLWLQDHVGTEGAGFVLRALLEQEGLSLEHRSAVVEKAFLWLQDHVGTEGAGFVLRALLEQEGL
ncbi:hypothetical protein, partial [Nocardiopsis protaetiae]|uniref:hypothetical protein n=1 Tax=Nocardiopsis protaetiae TaxID=3382270 RepID=UPI00387B1FE8